MKRADGGAAAALGVAVGLCGLGALSMIYRDFALTWELDRLELTMLFVATLLTSAVWAFASSRAAKSKP